MIRYNLRCADGHDFESWFRSADAYEGLAERGNVICPDCGSADVSKALMAPPVGARREVPSPAKMLARLKHAVETNSDYVGANFASEARAIHEGKKPERSIYGEARPDEARKLVEDGVPIAPLPFAPQRKTN